MYYFDGLINFSFPEEKNQNENSVHLNEINSF